MAADDDRPTWLDEQCPRWCRRAHREDDHPDDRMHEGASETLACIVADDHRPLALIPVAMELAVRRVRRVGEAPEWMLVEGAESPLPRLRVTVESAAVLAQALMAQLTGGA